MTDVVMAQLCFAGTNLSTYNPIVKADSAAASGPLIKWHHVALSDNDTRYLYSYGLLFQYTVQFIEDTPPSGELEIDFDLPVDCWVDEPNNRELKIPFDVINGAILNACTLDKTFNFVNDQGKVIHDPVIRVTRPPE